MSTYKIYFDFPPHSTRIRGRQVRLSGQLRSISSPTGLNTTTASQSFTIAWWQLATGKELYLQHMGPLLQVSFPWSTWYYPWPETAYLTDKQWHSISPRSTPELRLNYRLEQLKSLFPSTCYWSVVSLSYLMGSLNHSCITAHSLPPSYFRAKPAFFLVPWQKA